MNIRRGGRAHLSPNVKGLRSIVWPGAPRCVAQVASGARGSFQHKGHESMGIRRLFVRLSADGDSRSD